MIVEKKNAGITRSMIITENKLVEIGNDNQQIWHLIYKTQNEKDNFNFTTLAGGGWHDNGPGICKTEESGRGLYHN